MGLNEGHGLSLVKVFMGARGPDAGHQRRREAMWAGRQVRAQLRLETMSTRQGPGARGQVFSIIT